MKKVLSLVLVLAMVLMFSAVASADAIPADQIKVGLILLHDENIGYDEIHLNGFMEMVKALGLTEEQYSIKYNVPETEVCYDKAIELVDEGCDIIFADSFGHESYMLQAAAEHPEVQFCHATGYQAKGSGLTNMHNYFTAIYEARYVSGVPCVGYNVSMISVAPDSALTSAAVVWGPYYTYAAKCLIDGEEIATDWCKGYVDGAVEIKELNEKVVAAGTEETVNAVIEKLKNGELHVFDTSTFTVDGKTLEDETYVWDGYYHESELASAPSFTYIVDGITVPEA